jgi:hypothetical protein
MQRARLRLQSDQNRPVIGLLMGVVSVFSNSEDQDLQADPRPS